MKRPIIAVLVLFVLALWGLATSQLSSFEDRYESAVRSGGDSYARALLTQDSGQRLCSQYRGQLPAALLPQFLQEQKALIKYPAGGKLLGDWRNGEKVFTDPKRGNCYACHQGDPKELAYGNMSVSLSGYGSRGASEEVIRYTYEKIYNPWAYVPCSLMYRGGVHGLFTPEEIADMVAFLIDPNSPINRR